MDLETALMWTLWGTALATTGGALYITHRMLGTAGKIVEKVIKLNCYVSGFFCVAENQLQQQMQNLLPSDTSRREELEDDYNEVIAQHHSLLESAGKLIKTHYKFRPAKVIA